MHGLSRRVLCLILALWALCFPALGEDAVFDPAPLTESGYTVFMDDNGVDTVYRSPAQPFLGQAESSGVSVFVDVVSLANEGAVCVRFTLSVESETDLPADAVTLTVGGTDWRFSVQADVSEYDTMYYNDYVFCLTDESLPLLHSLTRIKDGEVAFTLSQAAQTEDGWTDAPLLSGTISFAPDELSEVETLYERCGGLTQDFTFARDAWPFESGKPGTLAP